MASREPEGHEISPVDLPSIGPTFLLRIRVLAQDAAENIYTIYFLSELLIDPFSLSSDERCPVCFEPYIAPGGDDTGHATNEEVIRMPCCKKYIGRKCLVRLFSLILRREDGVASHQCPFCRSLWRLGGDNQEIHAAQELPPEGEEEDDFENGHDPHAAQELPPEGEEEDDFENGEEEDDFENGEEEDDFENGHDPDEEDRLEEDDFENGNDPDEEGRLIMFVVGYQNGYQHGYNDALGIPRDEHDPHLTDHLAAYNAGYNGGYDYGFNRAGGNRNEHRDLDRIDDENEHEDEDWQISYRNGREDGYRTGYNDARGTPVEDEHGPEYDSGYNAGYRDYYHAGYEAGLLDAQHDQANHRDEDDDDEDEDDGDEDEDDGDEDEDDGDEDEDDGDEDEDDGDEDEDDGDEDEDGDDGDGDQAGRGVTTPGQSIRRSPIADSRSGGSRERNPGGAVGHHLGQQTTGRIRFSESRPQDLLGARPYGERYYVPYQMRGMPMPGMPMPGIPMPGLPMPGMPIRGMPMRGPLSNPQRNPEPPWERNPIPYYQMRGVRTRGPRSSYRQRIPGPHLERNPRPYQTRYHPKTYQERSPAPYQQRSPKSYRERTPEDAVESQLLQGLERLRIQDSRRPEGLLPGVGVRQERNPGDPAATAAGHRRGGLALGGYGRRYSHLG